MTDLQRWLDEEGKRRVDYWEALAMRLAAYLAVTAGLALVGWGLLVYMVFVRQ